MNKLTRLLSLALLTVGLAFPQSPVRITGSDGKEIVFGAKGTTYNSGLVALTTTPTSLTSSNLKVQMIHCKSNGTATTVTIKNGDDVVYYDTVSLAANSVFIAQYGSVGITFSGGIRVSAGANSAISCQIEGVVQ